jgi:hypothetical protein
MNKTILAERVSSEARLIKLRVSNKVKPTKISSDRSNNLKRKLQKLISNSKEIETITNNKKIITNEGNNNLKEELQKLIPNSTELKILAAYCDFTGIKELLETLKNSTTKASFHKNI